MRVPNLTTTRETQIPTWTERAVFVSSSLRFSLFVFHNHFAMVYFSYIVIVYYFFSAFLVSTMRFISLYPGANRSSLQALYDLRWMCTKSTVPVPQGLLEVLGLQMDPKRVQETASNTIEHVFNGLAWTPFPAGSLPNPAWTAQ